MACGQSCRRLTAGPGIKIEPDCCSGCTISLDTTPPVPIQDPWGVSQLTSFDTDETVGTWQNLPFLRTAGNEHVTQSGDGMKVARRGMYSATITTVAFLTAGGAEPSRYTIVTSPRLLGFQSQHTKLVTGTTFWSGTTTVPVPMEVGDTFIVAIDALSKVTIFEATVQLTWMGMLGLEDVARLQTVDRRS